MASSMIAQHSGLYNKDDGRSNLQRPRFSLGGQVSSRLATSTSSLQHPDGEDSHSQDPNPRHFYIERGLFGAKSTSSLLLPAQEVAMLSSAEDPAGRVNSSLNPADLLLREFTHDEQGTTSSPSSMFKSSFAKEVVQNVRRSMTSLQQQHQQQAQPSYREEPPPIVASPSPTVIRMRPRASLGHHRAYGASTDGDSAFGSGGAAVLGDNELWMSSTQFVQLLNKQELDLNAAAAAGEEEEEKAALTGSARRSNLSVTEETAAQSGAANASSYLDPNSKVLFEKLKQTCLELGFSYSDDEWRELRQTLAKKSGVDVETDLRVRNGDFFAALNGVAKKGGKTFNDRSHEEAKKPEKHLKESIKSDSELESCRSSDSGLERERERDGELASCYRNLAERDTDLLRIRLECQRLLEENRSLKEKVDKLKVYSNPRKHAELQKEIDHLKWQLAQMNSSRKTYELATQRLVSFLDEVTTALQATSPAHRRLVENTKAEVSKVARRANRAANHGQLTKRMSLDSAIRPGGVMSRAESMPGLNLDTTLTGSSHASSFTSSHAAENTSNSNSLRRAVQRSQSTQSKRCSPLPSLQEQQTDDDDGIGSFNKLTRGAAIIREEAEDEQQDEHEREVVGLSRSDAARNRIAKRHSFVTTNAPSSAVISEDYKSNKLSLASNASSDKDSGRASLGGGSTSSGRSTPNVKVVIKKNSSNVHHHRPSEVVVTSSSCSSGRSTPSVVTTLAGDNRRIYDRRNKAAVSSTPNLANDIEVVPDAAPEADCKVKDKYKSLGSLQIEPALPTLPMDQSHCDSEKQQLLSRAQKLLRTMKCVLARERTVSITPKKGAKTWRSSTSNINSNCNPGEKKPPNLQLLSQ